MIRKNFLNVSKFTLMAATIAVGLAACTGAFDDPFVSETKPKVYESKTISLADDSVRPISIIQISHELDRYVEANGTRRLVEGGRVSWSAISVADTAGNKVSKTSSEISSKTQCLSSSPDIKELIKSYSNLVVVCDEELLQTLRNAALISIVGTDGREHTSTSWGLGLHNVGLSNVLIYSVSM
jgi:hypothetical protein